jgi:uncharacterized protein (TIGR02118 family)
MTVKLVVLYTQPDDPDAFDERYLAGHGPLVEKLPGLIRWDTGRVIAPADKGEATFHRMAQLYFADLAALGDAMSTPEGAATATDFGEIAPPGSRMFLVQADD